MTKRLASNNNDDLNLEEDEQIIHDQAQVYKEKMKLENAVESARKRVADQTGNKKTRFSDIMLFSKNQQDELQKIDCGIVHLHKLQTKKRQMDKNIEEIKKKVYINLEKNQNNYFEKWKDIELKFEC